MRRYVSGRRRVLRWRRCRSDGAWPWRQAVLSFEVGLNEERCCKTAYKPYDMVVTAILIRATQLLGREYMEGNGCKEISSDGDWDEWVSGRRLVKRVFPEDEVLCPWKQ